MLTQQPDLLYNHGNLTLYHLKLKNQNLPLSYTPLEILWGCTCRHKHRLHRLLSGQKWHQVTIEKHICHSEHCVQRHKSKWWFGLPVTCWHSSDVNQRAELVESGSCSLVSHLQDKTRCKGICFQHQGDVTPRRIFTPPAKIRSCLLCIATSLVCTVNAGTFIYFFDCYFPGWVPVRLLKRVAMETRSNKQTLRTVPATQRGRPHYRRMSNIYNKARRTHRFVPHTQTPAYCPQTHTVEISSLKYKHTPGHTMHRLWPVAVWAGSIIPTTDLLPVSVCRFIRWLNVCYYQHSPSLFCSDGHNSQKSTGTAHSNRHNNNTQIVSENTGCPN